MSPPCEFVRRNARYRLDTRAKLRFDDWVVTVDIAPFVLGLSRC